MTVWTRKSNGVQPWSSPTTEALRLTEDGRIRITEDGRERITDYVTWTPGRANFCSTGWVASNGIVRITPDGEVRMTTQGFARTVEGGS